MSESGVTREPSRRELPGLNSLRFLAALVVIFHHIPVVQMSAGLPAIAHWPLSYRGEAAVCFFFVLSGFLISYLLLEELRERGTILVGDFYLRRACRIWPLYFAIVFIGLSFYTLAGLVGGRHAIEFNLPIALLLYFLFLPNLVDSLYPMGGILIILWSIGVEEQFYAFWAPLVKRGRQAFPWLCVGMMAVSFTAFLLNVFGLLGEGWQQTLVWTLKFHFMAIGGLCAWLMQTRRESVLSLPIFSNRLVQVFLLLLLFDFYLVGLVERPFNVSQQAELIVEELEQLLLYSWLIVTVAMNPRNLVRLHTPIVDYWGKISYGIYMYQMLVLYPLAAIFRTLPMLRANAIVYAILF